MPQIGQNAYSQSGGISPTNEPIQEARNPTSLDIQYPIYQRWINIDTFEIFALMSFDSSSGTLLADWRSESSLGQTFTGDTGGAVSPDVGGNLNILGTSGEIIVTGTPSANTLTISLSSVGTPIDSIDVDAHTVPGTDPVIPTSGGLITVTGAQVATGTVGANVIRTDSLAANAFTIEVQRSTAVAATDSTKNGVAHFSSGQFSVDSSGFVTLAGGGLAIDSIGVDAATAPGTNPVIPTAAGLITVTGAQVAPGTVGTNVIKSNSLAANIYTLQIQQTSAAGAKDITKNGVAHFNNTQFTNDQGFISLIGGGAAVDSFTPDTGTTPVVPAADGSIILKGQSVASVSGIKVTGGTNELDIAMFSPFVGDFSFQSATSGVTETLTIQNTSNTSSSQAKCLLQVAGATADDTWQELGISGTRFYCMGIDNSVAGDPIKFNYDTVTLSPSSGNIWLQFNPIGDVTNYPTVAAFFTQLLQSGFTAAGPHPTNSGIVGGVYIQNSNSVSSTADCAYLTGTTGASSGDPYITWSILGVGNNYALGIDNSDDDKIKMRFDAGFQATPSNGNELFSLTTAGDLTMSAGGISFSTLGKGISLKEGSNAVMGVSTLTNGTVTVSNTSIATTSRIFLTRKALNASTAIGVPQVGTITASTSFVINSLKSDTTVETNDASDIEWLIIYQSS